jgi:hypothetical protein
MPASPAAPPITLETTVPGRPAVADVLHEHLAEVAYLTIQWRKLLFSPEVPLRRLRGHAERIEAHLDGLRVGGPASLGIARSLLEGDDPWFVYAAARTWLEMSQPDLAALQECFGKTPPALWGAWKEALRKLAPASMARLFPEEAIEALPAGLREVATDALGWHGLLQPAAAAKLASVTKAGVRRAVARHATQTTLITKLVADENVLVRRTALWSLLRQEPRAALDYSRQMASAVPPDAFALRLIGLMGEAQDGMGLLALLRQKPPPPAIRPALRDLGRLECVEPLIEMVEGDDGELALAAQEVFESLAGPISKPDPEHPVPTGVSPARYHWQQVRKNLDPAKRYLRGRPFPWAGAPADEPMAWVWRRAIWAAPPELGWLRREVPDGFFDDLPSDEAIPGE